MSLKDMLDYMTSTPADWNARMRGGVASKSIGGKRAISADDTIGPNMGRDARDIIQPSRSAKTPTRVRETTTVREEVPATSGNFGSVQQGADNIGPNMGVVSAPSQGMLEASPSQGGLAAANAQGPVLEAPARRSFSDMDPMDQARSIMGGGKPEGFKKGGNIKSKPSRTKASKRGDGCATKGHTRGKYM